MRAPLWLAAGLWQCRRMAKHRLLIVDDDIGLSEMLTEYLAAEELELTAAASGTLGLREAQRGDYDLIILDVMLPGLSGFEVLQELRKTEKRTPVLMLTAKGDDIDRIVGLEMGADDYLPKPFNPRELVARIKAILRRTTEEAENGDEEIRCDSLRADVARREAFLGDEPLKLTNAEFVVLCQLMRNPGQVVSREILTRAALGRQLLPDDRSLDTHVSNLRKKIAAASDTTLEIRSIRGSGYLLVPPQATQ